MVVTEKTTGCGDVSNDFRREREYCFCVHDITMDRIAFFVDLIVMKVMKVREMIENLVFFLFDVAVERAINSNHSNCNKRIIMRCGRLKPRLLLSRPKQEPPL